VLAAFEFTKYFTFKPAPFHELMYQNFQDLVTRSAKEAAWIAYRDAAKTSIVRGGLVWLIARKQFIRALRHNGKNMGAWSDRLCVKLGSYDKANAKSILFDIVRELQAHELLIRAFGHLYYQSRTKHYDWHCPRCVVAYTNKIDPVSFYMTISQARSRPKVQQ